MHAAIGLQLEPVAAFRGPPPYLCQVRRVVRGPSRRFDVLKDGGVLARLPRHGDGLQRGER